ncbi:MAG: hotdog fold thioesterase [Blastocatellia bacterium]|nr:hotdog fold thioesterase [Blastocatellia bacterium]
MDLLDLLREHSVRTVHDTLGIEVDEATRERVVISMPVNEKVHQFTRILHGGVSVLLAESAASIGAALNTDLTQYSPVGVEINANHLRSISKGRVTATATPVYIGQKMMVWSTEVRDQRNRLISTSRCTLMLKPGNALKLAKGE